jgi:tripartite-type tricarboxylate transporter receptor subunit TctC
MRKILSIILLSLFSMVAKAEQTVNVVWAFSPYGGSATLIRQMIENANTQQNKYRFIFDNRPGAGGYIAASAVTISRDLAVLVSTTSFYVRPNLFKESHDPQTFSLLQELCGRQPLAMYSKKYAQVSDIVGREVSVGMNNGSITQLVERTVQANTKTSFIEIAYKGTPEATTDMLGGHVDTSVDFLGPMTLARFSEQDHVHVLGITGEKDFPGFKTFKSQNVKGLDQLVHAHYIFVKSNVGEDVKKELAGIFTTAIGDNVRKTCVDDFGTIDKLSYSAAEKLHQANIAKWAQFTKGMERQ